jgi:hypothetical protein
MRRFPHITNHINELFDREQQNWDYVFLRPLIVFFYFFYRCFVFPLKFLVHRFPLGCEGYLVDRTLSFGMKYLARFEAVELLVRHVQIEPLIYRHLLSTSPKSIGAAPRRFNGIDASFDVDSICEIYGNNMTIGHDQLSYEMGERFDKELFLKNLNQIRLTVPEDHQQFSKAALEENSRYSFQLLGPTNVAIMIVFVITIFADLKTAMRALNSFGSDSIVLWCLKHIYANNPAVLIDLDFFMQSDSNRGHYSSSPFFANPNQYLYYHIVFDEVVYEMLRTIEPKTDPAVQSMG